MNRHYNAAKNIGLRYLCDQQKSGRGGASVGVRPNNGTLNVNSEYSPTVLYGKTWDVPTEAPQTESNR